jgi:hypothetical protein
MSISFMILSFVTSRRTYFKNREKERLICQINAAYIVQKEIHLYTIFRCLTSLTGCLLFFFSDASGTSNPKVRSSPASFLLRVDSCAARCSCGIEHSTSERDQVTREILIADCRENSHYDRL